MMKTRISDLRKIPEDDLRNEDLLLLSIARKGKRGECVKESVTISLGELKSFLKDNRYREPVSRFVSPQMVADVEPLDSRFKRIAEKIGW